MMRYAVNLLHTDRQNVIMDGERHSIATASWFCLEELDPVAYIEVATESRRQSCTMQ